MGIQYSSQNLPPKGADVVTDSEKEGTVIEVQRIVQGKNVYCQVRVRLAGGTVVQLHPTQLRSA